MKKQGKKIIATLASLFLLASCAVSSQSNISLNNDLVSSQTVSNDNGLNTALNQAQIVLEKFPESRELFLKWQPENQEAFNFKQHLAQNLLRKEDFKAISKNSLQEVLKEKSSPFQAEKYKPIDFKHDQGNHLNKLSEWWYYNGHMNTPDGQKYGYELCFFRSTPFIYFAHIAITDENNQKFYYSREFYSPLKVDITKSTNNLKYAEDGGVRQTGDFSYNIWGKVKDFSFNLDLKLEKAPLLVNGNGLIDMPEGTNSYYYSLTRLKTSGHISRNGQQVPVTGQSWFDHQWGNFVSYKIGWDWFSFQMEDNTEYNLFSFRNSKDVTLKQFVNIQGFNNQSHHSQGFEVRRLKWWESPSTNDLYVSKWQLSIPQKKETFIIEAAVPGQEVFPYRRYDIAPTYWEGSCLVTKILPDGTQVKGLAYVEHFPYKNRIQ